MVPLFYFSLTHQLSSFLFLSFFRARGPSCVTLFATCRSLRRRVRFACSWLPCDVPRFNPSDVPSPPRTPISASPRAFSALIPRWRSVHTCCTLVYIFDFLRAPSFTVQGNSTTIWANSRWARAAEHSIDREPFLIRISDRRDRGLFSSGSQRRDPAGDKLLVGATFLHMLEAAAFFMTGSSRSAAATLVSS